MEIRVTGYEIKDKPRLYVVYIITVNGRTVKRRYSDFKKVYEKLLKKSQASNNIILLPLPGVGVTGHMTSRKDKQLLFNRQHLLDAWLRSLSDDVIEDSAMHTFLNISQSSNPQQQTPSRQDKRLSSSSTQTPPQSDLSPSKNSSFDEDDALSLTSIIPSPTPSAYSIPSNHTMPLLPEKEEPDVFLQANVLEPEKRKKTAFRHICFRIIHFTFFACTCFVLFALFTTDDPFFQYSNHPHDHRGFFVSRLPSDHLPSPRLTA